jgi:predicted nucleic acid-binding protein
VRVFVVDASLVVKWFVPEVHSVAARKWLGASHDYIAPDLVFPEAGNAIWKKVRRGEVSPEDAQSLVNDLSAVGVEAVSMRALVSDAHALAVRTGITVYDATYLTLAVRLETQVITGDDRFARKLAEHPLLAPHIRSVEDFVSQ